MSCVSSSSCTAVGIAFEDSPVQTLVVSWDGSRWSIVESPNASTSTDEFDGVSCVSSSFCVAVGSTWSDSGPGLLIESWDGSTWSIAECSHPGLAMLSSVSCVSSSSCVAVGFFAAPSTFVTEALVQVWDGSAWSAVSNPTTPGDGERLQSAFCLSESWCVGVGSTGESPQTLVVSLTGPEPEPTTTTTPTDQVIPTFAG